MITTSLPSDKLRGERRDCTVCALTHFLGLPYETCFAIAESAGRKDGQGMATIPLMRKAKELGYELEEVIIPRAAIATNGAGFICKLGTFYVCTARHAFAVKDCTVYDNGGINGRNDWLVECWKLVKEPADKSTLNVKMSRKNEGRFALNLL